MCFLPLNHYLLEVSVLNSSRIKLLKTQQSHSIEENPTFIISSSQKGKKKKNHSKNPLATIKSLPQVFTLSISFQTVSI